MKSWGWGPLDRMSSVKRIERERHHWLLVRTQWEGSRLQASKRALTRELNQAEPWFWTSQPAYYEKINSCCVSHPVCDSLLWQLELTKTPAKWAALAWWLLTHIYPLIEMERVRSWTEPVRCPERSWWSMSYEKTCPLYKLGKQEELWYFTVSSFLLSQASGLLKSQTQECTHIICKIQKTSWKIRLKFPFVSVTVHENIFSRCQIHSYWEIHGMIQNLPSLKFEMWFLNCWKWIV